MFIMTIDSKILKPLRQKHVNKDFKKAVLQSEVSFTALQRHGLHSGGLVCIVETRSAQQIWKALVCIVEAHGVREFPPSQEDKFECMVQAPQYA